jgi:hypothetical protein
VLKSSATDAMFLDLDTTQSRRKIATKLGLSMYQLQLLLESDEFAETYDDQFATLTSDPTVKAVQMKLVEDLLPKAFRAMDDILKDKKAPASVRLKAALETLRLTGVKAAAPAMSDRQDLSEFLTKHNIVQVNVDTKETPSNVDVFEGQISDVRDDQD